MKTLNCLTRFSTLINISLIPILLLSPFASAAPTTPTPAQSQTLRSTVEPSRAAEAIAPKPSIEGPTLPPNMQIQMPHGQHLSPKVAKLRFTLKGLKVINPVIFSNEELIAPFQDYFGKNISLGDLQDIANCMTTRYQQEGYVLTQVIIPPQRIKDNVVMLQVVPGFIDKVEVSGNINPELKTLLENYGAKIETSKPLQIKDLERYTLLSNDIPGMKVHAVLKPSKKTPGAADLLFISEQETESAYISTNNYGTKYLGPKQIVAGVEGNSYFRAGDSTELQVVSSVNKEVNFAELRHTELIGDEGLNCGVFGQYLKTMPGSTLNPLHVKGKYTVLGTEFLYPFIRSRLQNLSFNAGFMFLESKARVLGMPFYDDRIRPLYAGLTYNRLDDWQGFNQVELKLTEGLKIFGASGNTNISRPHGKSAFTKVNSTLSRFQPLPYQFSFLLLAQGQYSLRPLLIAEQYGYGGSALGRGYDPSEIIGDHGIAASAELRYDIPPMLCERLNTQLYAFYDAGKIWNRDASLVPRIASATSTGLGFRLKIMSHLEANFFIAKPLTRKVAASENRHMRTFFAIILKS